MNQRKALFKSSSVLTADSTSEDQSCKKFCLFSLIQDRPLVKLALVMLFNGFLSMACSAAIIRIEHPEQVVRADSFLLKSLTIHTLRC